MLSYKRKSTFPVREKKTMKAVHYAPYHDSPKVFLITLMFNRITNQERLFHYKCKVIK